jgi:hypothetical protein
MTKVKNLEAALRSCGIARDDKPLLSLVLRQDEKWLIEKVRTNCYGEGPKDSPYWLSDEEKSRGFWEEIRELAKEAVESGGSKLSLTIEESLDLACRGLAGKEIFAKVMAFFIEGGYVREDITMWQCRVFRFLDSYSVTSKTLMGEIWDHYETVDPINQVSDRVLSKIKEILTDTAYRVIIRQIDEDERCFEADSTPPNLSGPVKMVIAASLNKLRENETSIFNEIMTKDEQPG